MIDRDRPPAVLRPGSSEDDASLELAVGDEVIEVRVDRDGIHFRHPEGSEAAGSLPWDLAIALSLLPDSARRTGSTRAA